MAIKSLGHYQGEIEDIDTNSRDFKQLHEVHQKAIILNKRKEQLKAEIESIDKELTEIYDALKTHMKTNEVDWAWVWMKKRTNVKWKEEFVKACGTKRAEELKDQYATKEYPQVGIQFIDPIPESIIQVKSNPRSVPVLKHKLKIA